MQKKGIIKIIIVTAFCFLIGCFSFWYEKKYFQSQNVVAINNKSYQPMKIVNKSSTNIESNEPRILLEAAHGDGYHGECNHATGHVGGVTYYESLEARIMIDKIAGELQQAGYAVEISNEIAGDAYFTNPNAYLTSGCNPESGDCCGFRQGAIGTYASQSVYPHVDEVGPDNYTLFFELHFNSGGGVYSAVMVAEETEPYLTNGKKITDAVDSVIGTTTSRVIRDSNLFANGTLGSVNQFDRARKIPTYYLETFFMDYQSHMEKYVNSKDELAKKIADALIEIAGGVGTHREVYDDDDDGPHGGLTTDAFKDGFPSLLSREIDCRAVLVDSSTGNLNGLGQFLKDLFKIIKIASPIIAIVLTIIDYLKALTQSEVSMKKTNAKMIKRLAISILIFFLPDLLELLFNVFGLYDISNCNIA